MQNIILLHGALGTASELKVLADSLNGPELSAHTVSFSGHGTTQFSIEFGIEQFSKELEEFILKNNLTNVSVFGYSMGGFVALYLATQRPELINKIITLGTKFNWSKEMVEKETKLLNPEVMLEKIPAYTKILETKHGQQWKKLVLKTSDIMKEIGDRDFLNLETLQKLKTRTLIGIADKDQMVSLEETVAVYKALPTSSMYMLPGTKHQIETVNTSLLAKIILDFLI